MADTTIWWIIAGIAVAIELVSGTFYLLMLAIGFAAGALAAHAGMTQTMQVLVAAIVGGGAVIAWHLKRGDRKNEPQASANRDVNLDIGETVQVEGWSSDGTASIRYRGANWTAVPAAGASRGTGAHRVCEVIGSRLVVEKI